MFRIKQRIDDDIQAISSTSLTYKFEMETQPERSKDTAMGEREKTSDKSKKKPFTEILV